MKTLSRYDCLILMTLITLSTCGSMMLIPNLPAISHYFHQHESTTSMTLLAYTLGTAISQVTTARSLNKRHWLKHLNISLIWLWMGTLLSLYSMHIHVFQLMTLGRLMQGMGTGASYLLPFVLISSSFSYQQAKPCYAYTNFAFALWPYLAIFSGGLLSHHFGMMMPLVGFTLYATLITVLCRFTSIRHLTCPPMHQASLGSRLKKMCRSPRLILGALTTGALSASLYLYLSINPHLAFEALHFKAHHYGAWQLLSGITALAGHSFAIYQARRRKKPISLLKQAISMASVVLIALWSAILSHHWITPVTLFVLPSLLAFIAPLIFSNTVPLATQNADYKIEANMILTLSNHLFTLFCLSLTMSSIHISVVGMVFSLSLCWLIIAFSIYHMNKVEQKSMVGINA